MKHSTTDVVVIGGGAAGAFCAALLGERGTRVILLEPNREIGRKLRITGKGRCNLTNNCDKKTFLENIPVNAKFLHSALQAFSSADTMNWFENRGVPLKTERGKRVFPVSDNANDIANALEKELNRFGVAVIHSRAKRILTDENGVCGVETPEESISCCAVVLATGGKSYPGTGSTGDGFYFARELGHNVTKIQPSLVPLTVPGEVCPELMGLSLRNVELTVRENGKKIFSELGELLFTHFGVSGPLVLSASSHMRDVAQREYTLHIDLKPALDEAALDKRIQADFVKYRNSDFINALGDLLPKKLIPVVVRLSGIDPRTKVHSVSKQQRHALLRLLKDFTLPVDGTRPIAEAIVSSGGVDVREVSPKTMESKKIKGLYFVGEILDVDGYTGGFNLQIAWSTAFCAARAISENNE
ncbi:MAG: NAD(P)/FAD-dependent oxidoreductase [Ruminococcaceae bacterium]|nr:NAD(P)/FAD-dependent oxidoreductase [Oscillospiraceae bacterium]